ncbi:MAG: hypothetical protein ACJ71Z_12045 [Aeromicrobium sp.]
MRTRSTCSALRIWTRGSPSGLTTPDHGFLGFGDYTIDPNDGFTAQALLLTAWSNTGGYLTVGLFALAVTGLFNPRFRGLRMLCAATAAIVLAKSYALLASPTRSTSYPA